MPTGTRPTPPTRFCKLVYNLTYADLPMNNVMWLYLTGSGVITIPQLNDLAGACSEAYADNFLPLLSDAVVLNSTSVVLYDSGGDALEGVAGVGGTGAFSDNGLPAQVAMCISWQIAPHYRGGHPRTYLGGLTEGAVDSVNTWTGGMITAAASAAVAFHGDLEAITGISSGISTVEHGITSFVRAGAWRTPPVFYRIAGATVDARIDTQRRRLGRDVS